MLLALDEMQIKYEHCASTDYAARAQLYILRNFKPKRLFSNILSRSVDSLPAAKLYVAGFPCKARSKWCSSNVGHSRSKQQCLQGFETLAKFATS